MSAWDWFDRIFLINLDRRPDRLRRASARLSALSTPFVRFAALAPNSGGGFPSAGHHGCAASHRALCKMALASGAERVLVLEDDVILRDDAAALLLPMQRGLERRQWDVFFLGALCEGARAIEDSLAVPLRPRHSHAYALSRAGMVWFDRQMDELFGSWEKCCFDIFMCGKDALKFIANPLLAVQESGRGDTREDYRNVFHDYFTYCGAADFLRNCEELRR